MHPPNIQSGSQEIDIESTRFRARVAVSIIFVTNSFTFAWYPRLAEIQEELSLNDAQLGLVLGCGSLGGCIGGPFADCLIATVGSAYSSIMIGLLTAFGMPFIGLCPEGISLGCLLFFLGATDAVQDGCMNAHAMRVQDLYDGSILNTFHGFWSLGMIFGGLMALITSPAQANVSVFFMMLILSLISIICLLCSSMWLLPGHDPSTYTNEESSNEQKKGIRVCAALKNLKICGLGIFIMLAIIIELIPLQWSAIYLSSFNVDNEGIAYLIFNIGMTSGRFIGDTLVDRLSHVGWTRISMSATAAAMTIALILETSTMFIIACGIAGIGTATLYPSALTSSAHIPNVPPGTAISITTWLSRIGLIICPLMVGALAEIFSITIGIALLPFASIITLLISSILRTPQESSI